MAYGEALQICPALFGIICWRRAGDIIMHTRPVHLRSYDSKDAAFLSTVFFDAVRTARLARL